jgi:hypothetical protein
VFANWSYGGSDGIQRINMHENSTGSWVALDASPVYWTQSSNIEVPYTNETSIRLQPKAYIYPDYYSLMDYDDAKQIMRLNVTVTNSSHTVFSKQNLTLEGTEETDGNLWYLYYEVVLNFHIVQATIYTVYLTYEIYGAPPSETLYYNPCVNTSEFVYEDSSYLDPEDYGLDRGVGGIEGSCIENWIAPKDFFNVEQVVYKLDFTDIDNSEGDIVVRVNYRVESSSNEFKYRVYYNDTTKTDSNIGTAQTFAPLIIWSLETKFIDYILFYNYATPASVSSGNYSVWLDSVRIYDSSPSEDWMLISEVYLYLSVRYTPEEIFLGNISLIILGLVMIPASTVFLVYGGRDAMSQNKFFYFLVIFVVGWALFIGGIAP